MIIRLFSSAALILQAALKVMGVVAHRWEEVALLHLRWGKGAHSATLPTARCCIYYIKTHFLPFLLTAAAVRIWQLSVICYSVISTHFTVRPTKHRSQNVETGQG